jgi:predicted transcriptional regulator
MPEKTERKGAQPYSHEEILSFDRIRRAMTSRVLDRIEELWQGKQPIGVEQMNEVIASEWQKVKDAVRSSPAAREAFRKYLERTVSEQIDKLMKEDKTELESLGVVEKSL